MCYEKYVYDYEIQYFFVLLMFNDNDHNMAMDGTVTIYRYKNDKASNIFFSDYVCSLIF